jgi:hypothetical protein
MGWRFHRSIKAGPFRINFSKSGVGVSAGVKGFRVGVGPRGTRVTSSIPGTGISYVKESRWHHIDSVGLSGLPPKATSTTTKPKGCLSYASAIIVGLIVLACMSSLIRGGGDGTKSTSTVAATSGQARSLEPIQLTQQAAPEIVVTIYADSTQAPEPTSTSAPTPSGPVVSMAAGDTPINVRSGPSTNYGALGTLGPGDSASITGKTDDGQWWQILYNGKIAWVNASVAPVQGDTSQVMVVAVPTFPATFVVQATATPSPSFNAEAQAADATLQALYATSTALSISIGSLPTSAPSAPRACCKICTKGIACGNSCISASKTCHQPPGCACNG